MNARSMGAALTYVGAVVGAGFASGQEIYQFFARFGNRGMWGIGIVGLFFALLGYLALERGRRGQVSSFGELLASLYPLWMVRVGEGVTTAFLVVGLGVVAAGGGAALGDLSQTPIVVGAMLTCGLIIWVVGRGTSAVVQANIVLVPYLIVLVLAVAMMSWSHPVRLTVVPSKGWALSAFLYLSYNIFTGIMVLIGLGTRLSTRRESLGAALLGGGVLSLLALLEHHALMRVGNPGDLPMVDLASALHPVWGRFYAVSVWVALFTTGVADAYALRAQYGRRIMWLVGTTFFFSFLGFQRLVALLYPLMGVIAVMLWAPLVYQRKRSVPGG